MSLVTFESTKQGDWGYLVIDAPEKRNAVDMALLEEMVRVFERTHDEVRMVVLRGASDGLFLSGADVSAMREMSDDEITTFASMGHRFCRSLERSQAIVGALVGGPALGGGTEVALSADVVVATEGAIFGLPEVRLGIFPGWGGTQRLARNIGLQRALPLLLTGRSFRAKEAVSLGLAYSVVKDQAEGLEWFDEFASSVRKTAPQAVGFTKSLARQSLDVSLDVGLRLERADWMRNHRHPDVHEGMSAFIENRVAEWVE